MSKYLEISKYGKSDKDSGLESVSDMHQIMLGRHIDLALEEMYQDGVLSIIPGIEGVVAMKDTSGKNLFKDLWWHTKLVVKQSKPKLEIRWAALFHDFGKPACFSMENGKVAFHGHEHASVQYFKEFARKNRIFSPDQYNKISFLIYNLGYVESYSSEWTESAVRRFGKEMGDNLEDLLLLARADTTSSRSWVRKRVQDKVSELGRRVKETQEKDAYIPLLPKGIGNVIMEFGMKGKQVEAMKDELESQIEKGNLKAYQDLDYYKEYLNEFFTHDSRDA